MKKICVALLSLTFVACMVFAAACAQVFTVTFDGNGGVRGGGGKDVQSVKSAKDIEPPVYYREGYTFEGWDTVIQYITESCTVKARWKMWSEFKITLDANGGTFNDGDVTEIRLAYEKDVPELPVVKKEGYTFVGWKMDSAENGEWLDSGRSWDIMRNVTAYAVWVEANENNIIFWKLNGGTLTGDRDVIYKDEDIISLSKYAPKRNGYAFSGWCVEGNETVVTEIRDKTGKITIVAKWEAEEYTISFDANGATATVEPIKIKYGSVPELPSVEREDYVFAGWNTEKDGSGKTIIQSAWKYAENLTVYAKWETRGYSIKYNLNGGSFDESANVVLIYNRGDMVQLPRPTKAGRDFLYWREVDKDGKPISGTGKIEQINSTDTGNRYFVAVYSKIYTVKLSNTDIRYSANAKVIKYDTEKIKTGFTIKEGERLSLNNIPTGYLDKNDTYKVDGWIIVVNGVKKEYNNEIINDDYIFGTKESSETEIVIYPKLKNLWVGPY